MLRRAAAVAILPALLAWATVANTKPTPQARAPSKEAIACYEAIDKAQRESNIVGYARAYAELTGSPEWASCNE